MARSSRLVVVDRLSASTLSFAAEDIDAPVAVSAPAVVAAGM